VLPGWSQQDVTEDKAECVQWFVMASLNLESTDTTQVCHKVVQRGAVMVR